MNVLEQMVLGFQSLIHGLRLSIRPSLWIPWLLLLALQLVVVLAFTWFAHPLVSWLAAPVLLALAGEEALRYPTVFRMLPVLYARADLVIQATVGAVVLGASTVLFASWFSGRPLPVGAGLRRGVARAGALILANLPIHLLLLGFALVLDGWIEEGDAPSAVRKLAPLLTLGVAALLQAFFLWVNPLLVLGGRSLVDAFRLLPKAAASGAGAGVTIALAAMLPLLPIQMLARVADSIVDRGAPELVGALVILHPLLAIATAFLFTAASTLAYQSLVAPALEEREG